MPKPTKSPRNEWQEHLTKTKNQNPDMNLKDAMVIASKTYANKTYKGSGGEYKDTTKAYISDTKNKIPSEKPKKQVSVNEAINGRLLDIASMVNMLQRAKDELDDSDLKIINHAHSKIQQICDQFQENSNDESSDDDSD